jgi:hypothetical protein
MTLGQPKMAGPFLLTGKLSSLIDKERIDEHYLVSDRNILGKANAAPASASTTGRHSST